MNDAANHMLKNVIPEVTTRQWVLSFPYKIRYLLAHNQKLTNSLLTIFIRTIEFYQRKRIRNKSAKVGAISFIQRFGSALNLNVHLHTLMTDGVYILQNDLTYLFQRLPHPTHDELQSLIKKIKTKIERKLSKVHTEQADQINFDEESLEDISQISISHKSAFGDRRGQKLKQYGFRSLEIDAENFDPTTANNSGYSLNARVWIAYNKRKKLEQLIRYMARGPIAQERMSETYTGQILYKLKTPWRNGVTHFSYSGLDFIARLVALIPPPRMNMIRYHGVFAPNFKDRNKIVPAKKQPIEQTSEQKANPKIKSERLRWAEMLKKTFEIDVTVCPKCNGRLEQIALIKNRAVAIAILNSLNLITQNKPQSPPTTGPPVQQSYEYEIDQRNDNW